MPTSRASRTSQVPLSAKSGTPRYLPPRSQGNPGYLARKQLNCSWTGYRQPRPLYTLPLGSLEVTRFDRDVGKHGNTRVQNTPAVTFAVPDSERALDSMLCY
eukprot:3505765-Rhodomonas_salina.1